MNVKKGLLIVISGPSGVGKKTILTPLLEDKQLNLAYSISMTTRPRRFDEVNGKDYFFKTKEEFKQEVAKGNLLEWAVYCDNYYGTPKDYVNKLRNEGKNVLLEIEPQGAMIIMDYAKKNNDNRFISVFVAPESFDVLKQHLLKRGTESQDKIQARIKQAEWELTLKNKYDSVVINGSDPKESTERLRKILVQKIAEDEEI